MSEFIINAKNTSDEEGTIIADVGFSYTDYLNDRNIAEIKVSGTSVLIRSLLEEGSIIEILKDGARDFYGLVQSIDYLEAGGVVCRVDGFETRLIQENITTTNRTWLNQPSATIAGVIIGISNYWTAGTINTGTNLDFRANLSESLWGSLQNLNKKTGQDIGLDYVNLEVDILDHKGSSTIVATFNNGIDIDNLRVTKTFPLGNHIKVYGGGDGDLQATGEDSDATSISAYGRIVRRVIDRTIISDAEADKLATAELALTKDPTKYITFRVKNPNQSVVSGDHIGINSTDHDLTNEEVRIVSIKRGMEAGREFLKLEVTNPAYKQLIKNRNKLLENLSISTDQTSSYNKSTNIWSDDVSGNFSPNHPLNLRIYIPTGLRAKNGSVKLDDVQLSYTCKPSVVPIVRGNMSNVTVVGVTTATNLTGDDTWQALNDQVNSAVEYLMHACYGNINIGLDHATTNRYLYDVHVRLHNTDDSTYVPEAEGMKLTHQLDVHSYTHAIMPFYLHVPFNWLGKTWRLEYKMDNEANWVATWDFINYTYWSLKAADPDFTTIASDYTPTQLDYRIDDTTTVREGGGHPLDSGTYTNVEDEDVSVTSIITSTGWYIIELTPDKACYMHASVTVKANVDISSTL